MLLLGEEKVVKPFNEPRDRSIEPV